MKWLILLTLWLTPAQQKAPNGEFVFTNAPFASCHASTIVELKNGDLMSAWFGGTGEGKPDTAIWGARRAGGQWSAPAELVREPDTPCWNPVLFHAGNGRLWLYYKFGTSPSQWTAGRRFSLDEGATWSAVEHLPAGVYGPIRAKPLVLSDGSIISGSSVESYHSWAAWIERSEDNGLTWTRFGPISVPAKGSTPSTFGIIQPTVVSLGGRRLRFYARSTAQVARICIADSEDGGKTWTQARPSDLPNPNSGIDAVSLKDGRIVLVYNHTEKGRSPLNLAVSRDGEHFTMFQVLEDQPGEFSYPAMIQSRDGVSADYIHLESEDDSVCEGAAVEHSEGLISYSRHPVGMREGSQGQAKRSPWNRTQKHRVLKGREITAGLVNRERSRDPSGRKDSPTSVPGAALRLPLATLLHPFGMPEKSPAPLLQRR